MKRHATDFTLLVFLVLLYMMWLMFNGTRGGTGWLQSLLGVLQSTREQQVFISSEAMWWRCAWEAQDDDLGDVVEDLPGGGDTVDLGAAADVVGSSEEDEEDEEGGEEDEEAELEASGRRYPARTRALVQHYNPLQESHSRPPGHRLVRVKATRSSSVCL